MKERLSSYSTRQPRRSPYGPPEGLVRGRFLSEGAEGDLLLGKRPPHTRVAERFDLACTLVAIHRVASSAVTGMTPELGHAERQTSQRLDQRRGIDGLWHRMAVATLPVERADHSAPPDADDYWYGLIPEEAAATFRGVSTRKMQKDRQTGRGPKFIRLSSRCIRYRRIDLREDAEARMCSSTSDMGQAAA